MHVVSAIYSSTRFRRGTSTFYLYWLDCDDMGYCHHTFVGVVRASIPLFLRADGVRHLHHAFLFDQTDDFSSCLSLDGEICIMHILVRKVHVALGFPDQFLSDLHIFIVGGFKIVFEASP